MLDLLGFRWVTYEFLPPFSPSGSSHLLAARILQIVSTSAPIMGFGGRNLDGKRCQKLASGKNDVPKAGMFFSVDQMIDIEYA